MFDLSSSVLEDTTLNMTSDDPQDCSQSEGKKERVKKTPSKKRQKFLKNMAAKQSKHKTMNSFCEYPCLPCRSCVLVGTGWMLVGTEWIQTNVHIVHNTGINWKVKVEVALNNILLY